MPQTSYRDAISIQEMRDRILDPGSEIYEKLKEGKTKRLVEMYAANTGVARDSFFTSKGLRGPDGKAIATFIWTYMNENGVAFMPAEGIVDASNIAPADKPDAMLDKFSNWLDENDKVATPEGIEDRTKLKKRWVIEWLENMSETQARQVASAARKQAKELAKKDAEESEQTN